MTSFIPALPDDELAASRQTVIFGSLESGPGQRFTGSGLKHAPFGPLGTSGFRVMARSSSSQWHDRRKLFDMDAKGDASLLLGAEQMTGRGAIGIYMGAELATTHRTWSARASTMYLDRNRLVQRHSRTEGLRIEASLWDHPTPDLLVQLNAAFGSARAEAWGRAATGYRLTFPAFPNPFGQPLIASPFFAGPEFEISLAHDYTKWRVGAHVTGLKLFGFNLRLAAGREQASGNMRGVYFTTGIHWFR
jgi:hypothetical protein